MASRDQNKKLRCEIDRDLKFWRWGSWQPLSEPGPCPLVLDPVQVRYCLNSQLGVSDARLPNARQSDQSLPCGELETDDKASPYFLDPTRLCWGSFGPWDLPSYGTIHQSRDQNNHRTF
ncbi:hypothetical protein I7I51_06614 [Histoplasma capsulatum]|uniref:Uncharacterized protein n=1 Tax=Ajellomyces capsulatus TaxID=5037 RepID=A0A8A1MIS3_AJECA|nr:hypothetical protein I7I51_06614 [Histoplasma capsulatum]